MDLGAGKELSAFQHDGASAFPLAEVLPTLPMKHELDVNTRHWLLQCSAEITEIGKRLSLFA
jgi:hypothetical protein